MGSFHIFLLSLVQDFYPTYVLEPITSCQKIQVIISNSFNIFSNNISGNTILLRSNRVSTIKFKGKVEFEVQNCIVIRLFIPFCRALSHHYIRTNNLLNNAYPAVVKITLELKNNGLVFFILI